MLAIPSRQIIFKAHPWCLRAFFHLLTYALVTTSAAQSNALFQVGRRTFTYQDASRKRPLKTEVWYPTSDQVSSSDSRGDYPFKVLPTVRDGKVVSKSFPLLLVSHGTGAGRMTLEWLASALAQHGYIVAAVDHWGNTYDNKIPENFLKTWDRPLDVSFVLSALLKEDALKKEIDRNRIGALGFSLGGYTVLSLAGGEMDYAALSAFSHTSQGIKEMTVPELPQLADLANDPNIDTLFTNIPTLQDARIKAIFAMAPAVGQGFPSRKQLEKIRIPVFLVGAQSDSIAPVKTNALHYHRLIPQSTYYVLPGKAGHYIFLNEANDALKQQAPLFFEDAATIDRHQLHEQVIQQAVLFFTKHLKNPSAGIGQ